MAVYSMTKGDQNLLMIPLDSLNRAVLTGFNNLPFSTRAIDKLQTFKTSLVKHLLQMV